MCMEMYIQASLRNAKTVLYREEVLTVKAPNKNAADDILIFFYFYLSKKIRLDFT